MPVYTLGEHVPSLPEEGRYFVAPNAHIVGMMTVGDDVSFWFGAVARGDYEPIHIGARSNIQEHAMLHTDFGCPLTIGEDCTIGHGAILHGCTIGRQTLIGMGATILNRARIGSQCLVGANALITEGKEFPDRSLIMGSPAKVIRELNDDEVANLQRSADHYVRNGRRFAQDMRLIG
jgi:carbonic anhydrase/acetyltransferase-like protein (isoleucine patch superfamily)